MELEDKYQLLSKSEDELICFVCEEWCKIPVRLNKCGHYFCSACIPTSEKTCPKCKELFFQEDVTSVHWYERIKEEIIFFKNNLEIIKTILEKRKLDTKDKTETVKEPFNFPFRVSYASLKSFSKNSKGESGFHIACKKKDLEKVKFLIKENVDINSRDYACWTPLHEAIQAGSVEIVQELLANGAIIDSPGEFYVTPLHKAVITENLDIIKILVENGANKDALDFHGKKPADYTKHEDLLNALNSTLVKESIQKPVVYLVNKVVVYCHSIDVEYEKRLSASKKSKILNTFDIKNKEITHLLVKKTHAPSAKIFISIVGGIIIVRQEWIDNFLEGILDLPSEPILENYSLLSTGIRKALINHLMNRPKLFDGIKFYIENSVDGVKVYNLNLSKKFFESLVSAGGGISLFRSPAPRTAAIQNYPYHAHETSSVFGCCNIIIFNELKPPKLQYHMKELKHKSCKWLIDCVINFELI